MQRLDTSRVPRTRLVWRAPTLRGNEFVAYAVLTEWMFDRLMSLDGLDRWEQVKKLTSNYRKWRELDDYIEQCGDIIASKMQAAREVEYMA